MTLEEVRMQIDVVDKQIKSLFKERMMLADQVARVKAESEDAIYKPDREEAIITKLTGDVDDSIKKEYTALIKRIMEISRKYFAPLNPFVLALDAFTKSDSDEATRNMVKSNPDFDKTATVSEEFDNLLMSRFYKSLSYGMLIRANEYELEAMEKAGEVNPEKKAALEKARDIAIVHHKELTDQLEKEIHYQVVPIRKLVSIQLECGLLVSKYLHDSQK